MVSLETVIVAFAAILVAMVGLFAWCAVRLGAIADRRERPRVIRAPRKPKDTGRRDDEV